MAKNMISYGKKVFVQLHEKKEIFSEGNKIYVCGKVEDRFYRYKDEGYSVKIERKRPSGKKDVFWVIVPEVNMKLKGKIVAVGGEFRNGYIYSRYFKAIDDTITVLPNIIYLEGIILDPMISRGDKRGHKEVKFFMQIKNHEDVVACVAWDKLGLYIKNMNPGTKVKILGRLESRMENGKVIREVCLMRANRD